MKRISLLALAVVFAAASAASCSSESGDDGAGGGGSDACFDYSSFDGSDPEVSFAIDVQPIFLASCALGTTCHEDANNPIDPDGGYRPYIGDDVDLFFASIVGQPSKTAEDMLIVDPGSPENSFLMHKMDGTHDTCPDITCSDGCKDSMPQGGLLLSQEKRDTVRRWIAQGAQNN